MIEADKLALLGVIKELSNAMTRIESEHDFMKEAISDAAEKFQLEKKHVKKLATTYHRDNFNEQQSDFQEFDQLYTDVCAKGTL